MTAAAIEKQAAFAEEAGRHIALAATLDVRATTRTDGEAAVILAGVRSHMWVAAGISRGLSATFLEGLCHEFGTATVLAVGVAMCQSQPIGPKPWMRHACNQFTQKEKPWPIQLKRPSSRCAPGRSTPRATTGASSIRTRSTSTKAANASTATHCA